MLSSNLTQYFKQQSPENLDLSCQTRSSTHLSTTQGSPSHMSSPTNLENTARGVFSYDLIPLRLKLPEIRLLELFPAPNFTDDLWCRLYTVLIEGSPQYAGDGLPCSKCSVQDPLWYINLQHRYGRDACQGCGLTKHSRGTFKIPLYHALSYAWGDCTKAHEIFTTKPTEVGHPHHDLIPASRSTDGGGPADDHGREALSIPITASLESCLRQLRSSCGSESLTISIDQSCIDQSNDQEKSAQVELMRKIYSLAQQVVIWLGPTADGSDDVMDAHAHVTQIFWKYHGTISMGNQPILARLRSFLTNEENWSLPSFQDMIDDVVTIYAPLIRDHKIHKWLSREWFSRIWVIQELCLSREAVFVCGEKSLNAAHTSISLRFFEQVLWRWICEVSHDLPKMSTDILQSLAMDSLRLYCDFSAMLVALDWQFTQSWRGKRSSMRLLRLLEELYTNGASTSSKYRDRVYGLLGLASDADDLDIRPDYSYHTKTTTVLTQIARALIEKGHDHLEVLSWAQFPKQGVTEMEDGVDGQFPLPSWVPDWYNGLRLPYRTNLGWALRSVSANLNTSVQVIPTVLQSTLGLQGFLVDTIEEVGSYIQNRDSSAAATEVYDLLCSIKHLWHRSTEKGHGIYSRVPRQNEALWRVPICDLWRWSEREDGCPVSIRPPSELGAYIFEQALEYCRIRMSMRHQRMQHTTPDVEFTPILSKAEEELVQQAEGEKGVLFEYLCHIFYTPLKMELRPYLTKKGYMGLAPSHTQPGDVLVIFSGGPVPYVIRPVTADTDRYRFKPDPGNQVESGDQSRVDSATEVKETGENFHDPNFKLPESPLYTEAEIHAMYEQYKSHQSSRPPPEPVVSPTRPDENDSIYTFVGEAFCDGIMDGEFMERAGESQDFFLV